MTKLTDGKRASCTTSRTWPSSPRCARTARRTRRVVWVDCDGEHVLLNLNNFRAKLEHLERDPRVSVLTLDRNDPFRRSRSKGTSSRSTTEGAYEHIVRQAGVYLGKDEYPLRPGEERVLVRIAPERVEATTSSEPT